MLIPLSLILTLLFNLGGIPHNVCVLSSGPKPDFTGIWNARILRPADGEFPVEHLKISYRDPKLKISRISTSQKPLIVMGQLMARRSSRDFVYYTDGRGETQKSSFENGSEGSTKSKTERIGEKFVTTASYTSKLSGRKISTARTITLEVSSDGTTLTETTTLDSEGRNKRIVHLYDRLDDSKSRDINGEWVRRVSNRIVSLIIEHHDPEINVTRRVLSEGQDETETSIYYSDGRGEINVKDGRPTKSVTKWKEDSLIFAFSSTSSVGGDNIDFNQSIKWEIAKGGASLLEMTQVRMATNKGIVSPESQVTTLVYARSSKPLP